ncbi:MAG TPA: site-specific integrase [Candidatus Hydrogenedentes bacterium]|nr:site-specific integrase [Candidatus Hydrogenedentota bacterium]
MNGETGPRGRVRLSQKLIEALPSNQPDARRREKEYADSDAIGLRVSVSKGGRKFFDYRYRHNRRKRVLRLGEWPGMSLQDARDRARECRNLLYRGIDPSTERETRTSVMTFGEFSESEYLPFARANKKSARDDENKLKRDLLPAWGRLPLTAITTKDVQALCTRIRTESSPTYANRYYSLIHRIFSLAILWGKLDGRNPAKGVAKAKESAGRERFLSRDEIERFTAALDACRDTDFAGQAFLRLLLATGVRCGEALSLEWVNVDLERGVAFLPKTKSGRSRQVVLNELAKEVLRGMLERRADGNPFVFPGARPGAHMAEPRRVFERVKAEAKLGNLRLHDLRHTFASVAVQNGASLYEVQKLLGHSSSVMTQRYSHLSDDGLRAVSNGVAKQIAGAAE